MRTLEQIQQDIAALSDADRAALAEWLGPADRWQPSPEQLAEWSRRLGEYRRTGQAIDGEEAMRMILDESDDDIEISLQRAD